LRISKVLPDRWLDDQWPQPRRQGRRQPWPVSQLVRVHLLALLKGLGAFNRVCRELAHNVDFRRFCRVGPRQCAPTPSCLSQFREAYGTELWPRLHRHLLSAVVALCPPSAAGLIVLDSTDLPAAVRRTSKKKSA
jgi:hypothetical protein